MISSKFYAVAKGRKTGIFTCRKEAAAQVNQIKGSVYRRFPTRDQAQAFLDNYPECPSNIKYYAVAHGRTPGIYTCSREFTQQVHQFKGAIYRVFPTEKQAQTFISNNQTSTIHSIHQPDEIHENPIVSDETDKLLIKDLIKDLIKEPIKEFSTNNELNHQLLESQLNIIMKHIQSLTEISQRIQSELHRLEQRILPCPNPNPSTFVPNHDRILRLNAIMSFDGSLRLRKDAQAGGAGVYLYAGTTRYIPVNETDTNPTTSTVIHKARIYCGSNMTSTETEYTGLLHGLILLQQVVNDFFVDEKDSSKSAQIQVYGDSSAVIDQIEGRAKIYNSRLQTLHASCIELIQNIQSHSLEIRFQLVPREQNTVANGFAIEARNHRRSWTTTGEI